MVLPSWPIEPLAVPAEADPAEAPRVAEDVLVGQVGLVLGHRARRCLADSSRVPSAATPPVRCSRAKASTSAARGGDQAGRAERARQLPDRRGDLLAVRRRRARRRRA